MREPPSTKFVLSVLVGDNVGILRDISTAVTALGASIDGITQTVLQGHFTVTLVVRFTTPVSAEAILKAVTSSFPQGAVSAMVHRFNDASPALAPLPSERYILTLSAARRQDVLPQVTAILAARGINIEDWHMITDSGGVTHLAEIAIPAQLDIRQLHTDLRALLAPSNVSVALQHENIFRATNEIAPVSPLLGSPRHA